MTTPGASEEDVTANTEIPETLNDVEKAEKVSLLLIQMASTNKRLEALMAENDFLKAQIEKEAIGVGAYANKHLGSISNIDAENPSLLLLHICALICLDEVKKDLTAEEASEKKKYKLAELGTALLADPESNIKNIKEMLEILRDGDSSIVILGLKSLLAVFKDIIPGYRIGLPSEREQEMKVSKTVKKMRFYESTLLSAYKAYVQKLIALQLQMVYKRVAVYCLCTLLAAVPHFNFRESLLAVVVKNISSQDDVVR